MEIQRLSLRAVIALSALLCAACAATAPTQAPLGDRELSRIRELAPHPLPVFLARYYANSVGPADAVSFSVTFGFFANKVLYRPKAELAEYCALNGGSLLRQAGSQRSWRDVSIDAFGDPRTAGSAATSLRNLCDANALNPACGAAKASREGVFGNFQCRAKDRDRLLWTVSIEGSAGLIVSQTPKMARMEINLAPVAP